MYVLDMFPYPSGSGLHVGHPEGYTATDIVCRYRRCRGYSVMHPMGWDAFGLPAEQHAKKTGTHPRTTTENNVNNFRRQLKMLGFSYDWDRELATTDVDYFRWTQFIFLVIFDTWYDAEQQKGRPIGELPIPDEVAEQGPAAVERYRDEHRLAYQIEAPVNWCPALGTVLANEEVIGGLSERGGHPVVRMPLRQWMLRITAYADRLEKDLDGLDWSESIKVVAAELDRPEHRRGGRFLHRGGGQGACERGARNSKTWRRDREAGAAILSKPDEQVLRIYTTRPDTLFGATYMVIAPEHPFVQRLTTPEQAEAVQGYCEKAARKSDLDRTDLAKEKTGVFTGSYAINPVTGKPIPIWVADYVLISYGTGAIMAVPAHDERDFEFAKEFKLPIVPVVVPSDAWLNDDTGIMEWLSGLTPERKANIDRSRRKLQERAISTIRLPPDCLHRRRPRHQQRPLRRPADGRVQTADRRRSGRQGSRPRGGELQAPRLALQPPAFLGRAVPDPPRAGRPRPTQRADPRAEAARPAAGPAGDDAVRRRPRPP